MTWTQVWFVGGVVAVFAFAAFIIVWALLEIRRANDLAVTDLRCAKCHAWTSAGRVVWVDHEPHCPHCTDAAKLRRLVKRAHDKGGL